MCLLALALTTLVATAQGDDWPHIRGPKLDGRVESSGLFEGADVGFVPSWTAPLGSSYAGVVIAEGRVVTAFSDGTDDILIAFDEATGSELWRRPMAPTYRGHDGSDDGVISNPLLGDGRAFALTPGGRLLSVLASDGEVQWSVDLRESLGAPLPEHGFGSTPILEDGRLILHVGGEHSLCAFDPATGDLLWSTGPHDVWYQSPLAMDLAGRRQLVVLARDRILGLSPADGRELWSHPLEGRSEAQTGIPTPVDAHRFFAFVSGQLAMFEVQPDGDGFLVQEQWRSRELGRTYATPVFHDGHLYGFKNDFLTCIDATTGRRVWKSRPPGGRGLIGIEDRLLVFGAQGIAALVHATPEGYLEDDRFAALESTGYSWPSFASNALFVRNLDALARVEIRDRAAGAIDAEPILATLEDPADRPAFARFQRHLSDAGLDLTDLQTFLDEQATLPLVDDGFAHLLFKGAVEDVAVSFSGRDASAVYPMQRIEGTDYSYKGFAVEPGHRYEYRFQVDFDEWREDPSNPRTAPARRGTGKVSSLITEGFVEVTPFADGSPVATGRLDEFQFESEQLGNTRTIRVYTPAGYDGGEDALPLLIAHRGQSWVEKGLLPETLDRRIGRSVRPMIVAFVDPIPRSWLESGGTGTDAYLDMLSTEFLEMLRARYRISDAPRDVALLGTGRFALTAAYGALRHPEAFGDAICLSVDLEDVATYPFFDLVEAKTAADSRFYVGWNRFENRNIDRGFDKSDDCRRFDTALRAQGYEVVGSVEPDSYGWAAWRSRAGHFLDALFPLEDESADSASVVVTISVDWEGAYVLDPNVSAMAELRKQFESIPLTHFLNAAYFARLDDDAEADLVAEQIATTLRPHDEIGLHVHCWESLVERAGVTFRDQPTFFGGRSRSRGGSERGHDVELDAYDVDEIEAILNYSKERLAEQGYDLSQSFRCPGWLASPNVLHAARAAGFVIDSSSTDPRWHKEELAGRPILDRLHELWPNTTVSTQPHPIDTPAGPILEMPDTGALADYIDGPEMIGHLQACLAEAEKTPGTLRFAHIGFHHETAARYLPRIIECLEQFAEDPRVTFVTLKQAADLHRAQSSSSRP